MERAPCSQIIGFLGSPVYSTDQPGTTRGVSVSALNKKAMKVYQHGLYILL